MPVSMDQMCVGEKSQCRALGDVMEEVFESETGVKPVVKKAKCDLPRVERTNAA